MNDLIRPFGTGAGFRVFRPLPRRSVEACPAMGLMRLTVHDRDRIPPGGLEQVHMCGQDDLPWFSRAYFSGDQLVIERNEDDSGRVFVPWRIGQAGPVLINTATLAERDRPYLLEVELARGMLNNLRNQIAQWETMGLVVSRTQRWRPGSLLRFLRGPPRIKMTIPLPPIGRIAHSRRPPPQWRA